MNNPMSRKLFQTREAREKLRGMGGILASSPELSQTVARFRDGMMVNATPFDQIAQLVPNMSQQEMVAAGMPSLGLPRREIVELFERVDPNIGPEEFAAMTRQERIAAGFSALGALNEAYFAARARLLESQFPEQGPSMPPPVPTTSLSPENFINPADEFAGVAADSYQLPEVVFDTSTDTPPPPPADGTTGFDLFPAEPIRPITTAPPPAQTPPAETTPPPAPVTEEPLDSDEKEVLDTEFKQLLDDDQRLTENDNPDPEDLETLAQRRIELYRRLFGEDEPTPRDKNMQLAMIGLAIAAGQSPDALTNIAQGALTGLQAISAEDSARRDRDRELRGAAVSGLLSEQADARKETLAQRNERLERFNRERQEVYMAALNDTTGLSINDPIEKTAYAQGVAEAWARTNYPDLVGAPATNTVPTGTQRLTTREQIQELAPGTKFIWTDGREYTRS